MSLNMRDRRPTILHTKAQNETRIGYTLVAVEAFLPRSQLLRGPKPIGVFPFYH